MTLVVARVEKGRIAIAADTLISAHGSPLPISQWALKSICLPGNICVSYSGSPELAGKAFQQFRASFPFGANYATTVEFFETSSAAANNDYIIAFASTAKLVTVQDGHRRGGLSKTHWIGDKSAYTLFRKYEIERGRQFEHGRAANMAMFADEMTGSPASDLYSIMRNVALDRNAPSVGGFITVVSNRDIGFRFSVYSDFLVDWPYGTDVSRTLSLTDKVDLRASGENDRYSVSQISPGYYNMNAVAFYVLKGRLLVVFYEAQIGETVCRPINNVEPSQIATALDQMFGMKFGALCMVMSVRSEFSRPIPRDNPSHGIGISVFCEANTMPKITAGPE